MFERNNIIEASIASIAVEAFPIVPTPHAVVLHGHPYRPVAGQRLGFSPACQNLQRLTESRDVAYLRELARRHLRSTCCDVAVTVLC